MLADQICNIKQDFSQNLADVKNSMIGFGYDDEFGSNSIRDGDLGSCTDDNFFGNMEEEKLSNASKTSKSSYRQPQIKTNQKSFKEEKSHPSTSKGASYKKLDEMYERIRLAKDSMEKS